MRPIGTAEELQDVTAEANPGERLWKHIKHGRLANFAPKDTDELRVELVKRLEILHRHPELLASFNRHAGIPIRLRG